MSDAFQLTRAAALRYDEHSVPALFAPLAKATMDQTALPDDASVIDIACGTGALTREIAARLGGTGRLVGTDLNATMIEVACERHPAGIHEAEYVAADVSNLPYEDGSFDHAFLQQGLQFFPDKPAALREIARVLRPGGCLVLTCWRAISPFNKGLADAIGRHIGEAAAAKASAPFSFRDGDTIKRLLQDAALEITRHDAIILERRFEGLRAQILALPVEKDLLQAGESVISAVVEEVEADLSDYADGNVYVVPQEAHLFLALKVA
jgi:ubiquinone/menaquinone biosynthesis C-methylase UbiE